MYRGALLYAATFASIMFQHTTVWLYFGTV